MGIARDFPTAFAKAQAAAGARAAEPRHGVHHRRRRRQAGRHRDRHRAARPRLRDHRHPRHRAGAAPDGDPGRGDQQDRRGLAARRRLDRARRGRPGDQHPGRHRRAHRRLRDPLAPRSPAGSRASPRWPAAWRPPGRSPPRRRGEPEVLSLQEIHAGRDGEPGVRDDRDAGPRVTAPFGRRAGAGHRPRAATAPTSCCSCDDPDGPAPARRASSTCCRGRALGRGGGRAAVPAARVQRAARARRTASCEFLLEDVGPGTHRLCELEPGDELLLVGPLGIGFAPPRDGRRPLLVGGGVGIAPLAIWQDRARGAERLAAARLPRRRARRRAPRCSPDARVATDDGSVGHHGLVTDLLDDELDRDAHAEVYACGPPAMLEAVRAICAERGRPGAAGARVGHGLRLRRLLRLRRADPRRLRPPVRRRPGARRRAARDAVAGAGGGTLSRSSASAGSSWRTRSSTRRGRSTRSPPAARSATRCSSASRSPRSSPRRSRSRRARATRRRGCGSCRRDDQLDRPAEQGPGRLPRARPAASSPRCRCR